MCVSDVHVCVHNTIEIFQKNNNNNNNNKK